MGVEEGGGLGDDGLEVEVLGDLGDGEVQDVGLVEGDELGAAAQDDAGEDVDGEDLLARQERVEQACDVAVPLHVVGEHGKGVGEREVGLDAREVGGEGRVDGP